MISRLFGLPGLFLVLACSGDDRWLLAPKVPTIQDYGTRGSYQLVPSHTIGDEVIEDPRGLLATSASGYLAISEPTLCRVSVFDIKSGVLRYQVGKCGAGPHEFQRVSSLLFVKDSLIVFDGGSRRITIVDEDGGLVDSYAASELWPGVSISLAGAIAAGPAFLASHPVRDPEAPLVTVIDRHSGSIVSQQIPEVEAVGNKFSLGVQFCGTEWPNGPVIVVQGTWRLEGVAIRPTGGILWHSLTDLDWLRTYRTQGEIVPTGMARSPICGSHGVMLRMSRTLPGDPANAPWKPGYFEVRDWEGKVLLRSETSDEDEMFMQSGASWADYWMFVDPASPKPRIQAFRLEAM